MYLYIYDDYLKKHNKIINKIEIKITDLGLNGKIIRLENIKNIKDLISGEAKRGAKTIIAVGNNNTLNKVINSIIDSEDDLSQSLTVGIIPVGDNNSIALALGVNNFEEGCNIILARRLENIDIGKINDKYFISNLKILNNDTSLKIDDSFIISPVKRSEINIINLISNKKLINIKSSPKDGLLDIYINNNSKDSSFLQTDKLYIQNESKILIDDTIEDLAPEKSPINIEAKKINIIVGKDRFFQ